MGKLDKLAWEARAIAKHGSLKSAKQEMSKYGSKNKGIKKKRTVWGDNPEIAREAARSKKKG